jgi:hypothetical protein
MLTAQYVRALVVVFIVALLGGALVYARYEAAVETSVTLPISLPQPITQAPPTLPHEGEILARLRQVMLAVDHGMKTGNFTVLRDIGARSFHKANSAAKLAQIFGALSEQGVDLLAAAVVDPTYSKPPSITPERMLYISGVFPIQPRQAAFEILLEREDGDWRLYGIAVAPAAK